MADAWVILKSERNQHFRLFSGKTVHISTNSSILQQQNAVKNELPTVPIQFHQITQIEANGQHLQGRRQHRQVTLMA